MNPIIKKTIDEIKKAERRAEKEREDTEKKREQVMATARERIAKMEAKQKTDLLSLRESRLAHARDKAKGDAADLLKKEKARIKAEEEDMRDRLPKAVDLILQEFKKEVK